MSFFKKDKDKEAEEAPAVVDAAPAPSAPIALTFDQIQSLMQGMAKTIVEEMKKPTEAEFAKMEKERQEAVRRMEARIEVGKAAERERLGEQQRCAHKRDDGRTWSAGGQKFSDGKLKIFCLRCQKILYDGVCPPEMENGVGWRVELSNVQ